MSNSSAKRLSINYLSPIYLQHGVDCSCEYCNEYRLRYF